MPFAGVDRHRLDHLGVTVPLEEVLPRFGDLAMIRSGT